MPRPLDPKWIEIPVWILNTCSMYWSLTVITKVQTAGYFVESSRALILCVFLRCLLEIWSWLQFPSSTKQPGPMQENWQKVFSSWSWFFKKKNVCQIERVNIKATIVGHEFMLAVWCLMLGRSFGVHVQFNPNMALKYILLRTSFNERISTNISMNLK